ncbi:MAG: ATP synthase F0 subunit C [Deltaproteobacteria bacterium]|nr:ATP synthase F0 subunit C [Deltaproteobacteria bacterium]
MKKALSILSMVLFTLLAMASVAFAADAEAGDNKFTQGSYIALAAGLGLGIAAFGGALGQGKTAAAALEGIARNPGASDKLFTPMILGLALIESLVIYALVIAFVFSGKFA